MGYCAIKTLSDLAYPGEGCKARLNLGNFSRIKAYSLDSVGDKYHKLWMIGRPNCADSPCPNWKQCGRFRLKDFKTADALCICQKEGVNAYYFIEFKTQPSGNVRKEELWGKAFESLGAAALTELEEVSMKDIRDHAEFIVVLKTITEETPKYDKASDQGFKDMTRPLKGYAEEKDNAGAPILFSLQKFVTYGLYRAVHTFDDEQFRKWAEKHLPPDDGTAS